METIGQMVQLPIIGLLVGLVAGWLLRRLSHPDNVAAGFAFGFPEATVRATLAYLIVGSYVYSVIVFRWSPEGLAQLASTMIGYYFGQASARVQSTTPAASPPPADGGASK